MAALRPRQEVLALMSPPPTNNPGFMSSCSRAPKLAKVEDMYQISAANVVKLFSLPHTPVVCIDMRDNKDSQNPQANMSLPHSYKLNCADGDYLKVVPDAWAKFVAGQPSALDEAMHAEVLIAYCNIGVNRSPGVVPLMRKTYLEYKVTDKGQRPAQIQAFLTGGIDNWPAQFNSSLKKS